MKYTKSKCDALLNQIKDDERKLKFEQKGIRIKSQNIKEAKIRIKKSCK